jgi:hypothetical protein
VICVKSKFFRAACSERWKDSKEGQEKVVRLPEVEPEVFQRYVDWTYRDALVADTAIGDAVTISLKLYLLGDLLDDVRLRNKTTKALMRHVTTDLLHPNAPEAQLIWEKTTPSSLIRKLVVDGTVLRLSAKTFAEHIGEWPAGLVQQVAISLKNQATDMKVADFQAKLAEYLEVEDGA